MADVGGRRATAPPIVLAATLGLAIGCWVLPAKAAIDVPLALALAIVGLGLAIVIAPALVPVRTPSTM